MLNSPRPYHHIRAEWIQCAAKGERRTLVIQSSELYKAIDEDKTLLEELFMVAMSKRGLPVFLWLAQTYPPPYRVLRKALGQLTPDAMKTVLSNRPFPSQTTGSYPSLTESMARHPQGWETAIINIDLCIKSGMSEQWSEPYGELYRLAKLSPQAWGKLVKEEDHAFKQLLSIGVKVKEWDPLVKPEHGHPLECALSSGNLEAATWLLQASSFPLKAPYLGELLEHARPVGKWSIYSWPQNDQIRHEFVRTVVERAGPLKVFALNKARDHLPPSMLAELEHEVIADTTSITTTSPRSRRL